MRRSADVPGRVEAHAWTHVQQLRDDEGARRRAPGDPPPRGPSRGSVAGPAVAAASAGDGRRAASRTDRGRRPDPYDPGMLVGRAGLSPVMVGRAAELGRLRALLGAAPVPAVALVAGEAGIGKTRLVQELVASAPAGTLVLAGQADPGTVGPTDGAVPRRPRPHRRERRPRARVAWSTDAEPVRRGAGAGGRRPRPVAVRGRPGLVVFEDLHWADSESLAAFELLAEPEGGPLVLVGTYRPDGLSRRHPAADLLPRLERRHSVTHLQLARFSPAEVSTFLAAVFDQDPSFRAVDALHTRTGGNPFFLEELVASAGELGGRPRGRTAAVDGRRHRAQPGRRPRPRGADRRRRRVRARPSRAASTCWPPSPAHRSPTSSTACGWPWTAGCSWRPTPTSSASTTTSPARRSRAPCSGGSVAGSTRLRSTRCAGGSRDHVALTHHARGAGRFDEMVEEARLGAHESLQLGLDLPGAAARRDGPRRGRRRPRPAVGRRRGGVRSPGCSTKPPSTATGGSPRRAVPGDIEPRGTGAEPAHADRLRPRRPRRDGRLHRRAHRDARPAARRGARPGDGVRGAVVHAPRPRSAPPASGPTRPSPSPTAHGLERRPPRRHGREGIGAGARAETADRGQRAAPRGRRRRRAGRRPRARRPRAGQPRVARPACRAGSTRPATSCCACAATPRRPASTRSPATPASRRWPPSPPPTATSTPPSRCSTRAPRRPEPRASAQPPLARRAARRAGPRGGRPRRRGAPSPRRPSRPPPAAVVGVLGLDAHLAARRGDLERDAALPRASWPPPPPTRASPSPSQVHDIAAAALAAGLGPPELRPFVDEAGIFTGQPPAADHPWRQLLEAQLAEAEGRTEDAAALYAAAAAGPRRGHRCADPPPRHRPRRRRPRA